MKLIEQYLNQLYAKDDSKDVLELKQEMRAHLMDSVNELILEGFSEDDACKEAINRFDGGLEMKQEINKLTTSLDRHKSVLKLTKKILGIASLLGIIASGIMIFYTIYIGSNREALNKEFNNEIIKLAQKYDMTDVDAYKSELDELLTLEKYKNIKVLRLSVADMEKGNTSTSGKDTMNKAKVVYEADKNSIDYFVSTHGYDGTDFLDIDGNVVNPNIWSDSGFYNQSVTLAPVAFIFSVISFIGYLAIKKLDGVK